MSVGMRLLLVGMSLGLVAVCGLLICHDLSLVGVCLRLRSMCLCLVGMRLLLVGNDLVEKCVGLGLIGMGGGLILVCLLLVCQELLLVAVGLCLTFCSRSTLGHCRRQQRGLILRERQVLQEAHATGL